MRRIFLLVFYIFLTSCSFIEKKQPERSELGFHRSIASEVADSPEAIAYDHAFEELSSVRSREASDSSSSLFKELQPSFHLFQKQKTSFRFLVFPKKWSMNKKTSEKNNMEFGRPLLFRWSMVHQDLCRTVIAPENKNFPKSQQAFVLAKKELASDPDLSCAVFRVFIEKPTSSELALTSQDVLEMYLYLDSKYRAYAVTYVYADPSKKEYSQALDPEDPLSSGLNFFPIDLPSFMAEISTSPQLGKNAVYPGTFLITQSRYVQDRFARETQDSYEKKVKFLSSRFFNPCKSNGRLVEYFDLYGDLNRVGWCVGEFMPRFSENQKYLAILDLSEEYNKE